MTDDEYNALAAELRRENRQPTEQETALIMDRLRDVAHRDLAAMGCSCEVTFTLTAAGVGPFNLPMWMTGHADNCRLTIQTRAAKQAATS